MNSDGVARGEYCNVMAVMISAAGWLTLVLFMFFPASAIARVGPGADHPSVRTRSSSVEQTPRILVKYGNIIQEDQQTSSPAQEVINVTSLGKNTNRRGLVGSSPPTCVGRCEACVPCKPVHVAITSPHPVISQTDYYPEVWRCLCGNKYYMP